MPQSKDDHDPLIVRRHVVQVVADPSQEHPPDAHVVGVGSRLATVGPGGDEVNRTVKLVYQDVGS